MFKPSWLISWVYLSSTGRVYHMILFTSLYSWFNGHLQNCRRHSLDERGFALLRCIAWICLVINWSIKATHISCFLFHRFKPPFQYIGKLICQIFIGCGQVHVDHPCYILQSAVIKLTISCTPAFWLWLSSSLGLHLSGCLSAGGTCIANWCIGVAPWFTTATQNMFHLVDILNISQTRPACIFQYSTIALQYHSHCQGAYFNPCIHLLHWSHIKFLWQGSSWHTLMSTSTITCLRGISFMVSFHSSILSFLLLHEAICRQENAPPSSSRWGILRVVSV